MSPPVMNIKTTSGFSIIFIGYSIYVIILFRVTTTLIEYSTLFKQLYERFYLFHNSYEVIAMVENFSFFGQSFGEILGFKDRRYEKRERNVDGRNFDKFRFKSMKILLKMVSQRNSNDFSRLFQLVNVSQHAIVLPPQSCNSVPLQ